MNREREQSPNTYETDHEDQNNTKRDAYIQKMKDQLDLLNSEISALEDKIDTATSAAKEQYQESLQNIYQKREQLNQKIQSAASTGKEAWSDIQEGLDRSWHDLKETFAKVRSKYFK
mgnify:CR=1 FL=1